MSSSAKRQLSERIPQDVLERVRKAGVSEVDWYAGRLDVRGSDADDGSYPDDAREVVKRHRAIRRTVRRSQQKAAVARFVGSLRRRVALGRR